MIGNVILELKHSKKMGLIVHFKNETSIDINMKKRKKLNSRAIL